MKFMVKSIETEEDAAGIRFFNLCLQSTGVIYVRDRDRVIEAMEKGEPINFVLMIEDTDLADRRH